MSRHERGQYFEALCGLRDAYTGRSEDDRRSSLLIEDAVTYAVAVMNALATEDATAERAAAAGITTLVIPVSDPRD